MKECGCIRCQDERRPTLPSYQQLHGTDPFFRYACELCGNKRCPHHTDHDLICTNSNEVGQKGSIYQ